MWIFGVTQSLGINRQVIIEMNSCDFFVEVTHADGNTNFQLRLDKGSYEQLTGTWTREGNGPLWLVRIHSTRSMVNVNIRMGQVLDLEKFYHAVCGHGITVVCDLTWEGGTWYTCQYLWFWIPGKLRQNKLNIYLEMFKTLQPVAGVHMPLPEPMSLYNIINAAPRTCRLSFNHIGDIFVCVSILLTKYDARRRVQLISCQNTETLSEYAQIIHMKDSLYDHPTPPSTLDVFFAGCIPLKPLPEVPQPVPVCTHLTDNSQTHLVTGLGLTLTRSDGRTCLLTPISHKYVNHEVEFPMMILPGNIQSIQSFDTDPLRVLAVRLSNGQWWFVEWHSFTLYPVQSLEKDVTSGYIKYTCTQPLEMDSLTELQIMFFVDHRMLHKVERYVRTKC